MIGTGRGPSPRSEAAETVFELRPAGPLPQPVCPTPATHNSQAAFSRQSFQEMYCLTHAFVILERQTTGSGLFLGVPWSMFLLCRCPQLLKAQPQGSNGYAVPLPRPVCTELVSLGLEIQYQNVTEGAQTCIDLHWHVLITAEGCTNSRF